MTEPHTTITVTGPGGTISYEYYTILYALKAAGLVVVEDNDFPQHDAPIRHNIVLDVNKEHLKKYPVKLVAKHQPWGG